MAKIDWSKARRVKVADDTRKGPLERRADRILDANPRTPLKLSVEEIDAARTPRGGWTRTQLAAWGVPWPPPRGWRDALLRGLPLPEVASAPVAPVSLLRCCVCSGPMTSPYNLQGHEDARCCSLDHLRVWAGNRGLVVPDDVPF